MNFDYNVWEYENAKGVRGDNHNFLMGSLFYDKEWNSQYAKYVLAAEAYYLEKEDKWLPSAYQIVVHAIDEHDAMKKLVGSLEQWDKLKSLKWFEEWLDRAMREQKALQEMLIKEAMFTLARSGDKQAAKIVLDLSKPKRAVGRPLGRKNPDQKAPVEDTDEASGRVVQFLSGS